jgi:predicted nucleic acid-binding protein
MLLGFVEGEGISVNPSSLGIELPDRDDLPFLEVTHAAEATLITGNTRYYPQEARRGVAVLDPASFLDEWTSQVLEQE